MAIAAEGALRMADGLLWANGGFSVVLRFPGPAASGSSAEELGLATPQFEDVPVEPAAWRKLGVRSDLLIAGSAVSRLVASQGYSSARSLFEAAVGVAVDGALFAITGCEPLTVAGVPCAYRLSVEESTWI